MPLVELPQGKLWYAARRTPESPYPPLLLVHGAAGSHLDWPAELRYLPGARVLAVDLPGHGRSPGPGRTSIPEYAADLVALLDALDIPQAIIVGHSMGSAIAQIVALDYPGRVAGIVLIGSGAKLRVHPDILANAAVQPEQVYDLITAWGWASDAPEAMTRASRKLLSANDPQVVSGDYAACNAFDTLARLKDIAAPALIIGGTADRMTPFKFSVTLAEQIPGAALVAVEGGGHMMTLERPRVVREAILTWLRKQA